MTPFWRQEGDRMKGLTSLYELAEQENIELLPYSLPLTGSMSVESDSGHCYIAMDYSQMENRKQERVHLSHELGHCITGSFYNRYASADVRMQHENRADKWAIHRLIPPEALDEAIAEGCTELWELAEHFQVTEAFIKKAVCLYTHGNIATELYF